MAGGVPSPGLAAVAVWIDHAIATNAIAATDLSMALLFACTGSPHSGESLPADPNFSVHLQSSPLTDLLLIVRGVGTVQSPDVKPIPGTSSNISAPLLLNAMRSQAAVPGPGWPPPTEARRNSRSALPAGPTSPRA